MRRGPVLKSMRLFLQRRLSSLLDVVDVTLALPRWSSRILLECLDEHFGGLTWKESAKAKKRRSGKPKKTFIFTAAVPITVSQATVHLVAYSHSQKIDDCFGHHARLSINLMRAARAWLAKQGQCAPFPPKKLEKTYKRSNYLPVPVNVLLDPAFIEEIYAYQLRCLVRVIASARRAYTRAVAEAFDLIPSPFVQGELEREDGALKIKVRWHRVEFAASIPVPQSFDPLDALPAAKTLFMDCDINRSGDGFRGKMTKPTTKNRRKRVRGYPKGNGAFRQFRLETMSVKNAIVGSTLVRAIRAGNPTVYERWMRGCKAATAARQTGARRIGREVAASAQAVLEPLRREATTITHEIIQAHLEGPLPLGKLKPHRLLPGCKRAVRERVTQLIRRLNRRALHRDELMPREYATLSRLKKAGWVWSPGFGLFALQRTAIRAHLGLPAVPLDR